MTTRDLAALLEQLIVGWEHETVEFKRAGDGFSTSDIGKYFSALANEANLRGADTAWLVFGVDNATRAVVGTDYRPQLERLHATKQQIADDTGPSVTFREIHTLDHPAGRVLLFEIPPAPRGLPIAWKGHFYARAGESLTSLGLDKQDAIRAQTVSSDWTAEIVPAARLSDLAPEALEHARRVFSTKHERQVSLDEVLSWPVETLLARLRLIRDGQLTRASLLLLGRREAAHRLSPHPAQLTWRLEGEERAYEHFDPPFLLSSTALYHRIRNVQLRVLPNDSLLPVEVSKYDQKIVLEALHNCIAHQDYGRNARVVVTEFPDRLVFENDGSFFEGQPADYLSGTHTPRRYRNPFLAHAMVELNMIDTMGYGIHRMYKRQARRYFPLPDYDLDSADAVRLTVHGRVMDLAYSRALIQHTSLSLDDILALDRVQKRLPLDQTTARRLRRAGLIEGRAPNLHVSAAVASATATQVEYIRLRGQDDAFYEQLVIDFIRRFGSATRRQIDDLLLNKLGERWSDDQKAKKVGHILTRLRRADRIRNDGSRKVPKWVLGGRSAE